jgi:hypothetical protein
MADIVFDPRDIRRRTDITISIDMTALEKEFFGWFHWRKWIAVMLLRLAAKILRATPKIIQDGDGS